MATPAKLPAAPVLDVVDQIVSIPVASIEIGKRLRSIDRVWAAALGKVIAAEGQNTPIEVCMLPGRNGWTLVAGAHRLSGAQIEGMAYIKAIVVDNDAQKRLEREISENLWRQDLAPLDRAAFIAELVALHKLRAGIDPTKDGRAVSAAARWQKDLQDEADDATATIAVAYGWTEQIGERLGLAARTVRDDLMLYRRIPAGLVARLREADHPALRNAAQLRALAKLDEEQQTAAIDRLLWQEQAGEARKPMTLAEACAAGKAKVAIQKGDDDKRLSAFIGAFSRMSIGEKKGALSQLAGMLPAGYKLVFGEQLSSGGFPEGHEEEADLAACLVENAYTLLDGLIEDEIVEAERLAELEASSQDLRRVSFAIRGDRFPLAMTQAEPAAVPPVEVAPTPAVAIRSSVKPDYLVCLDCGEKHEQLTRHLSSAHGLDKSAYLKRWNLPLDYPFVAPDYADRRREQAAKLGLARKTGDRA